MKENGYGPMNPKPINKGTHVTIGKGRKVYRVRMVSRLFHCSEDEYFLEATADPAVYPHAAVRVPDAFRSYKQDELTVAPKEKQ